MKRYIFLTLFLALFAVILTFTACGDSETTTAPVTTDGTTTKATVTENPLLVTAYDNPEAFVTLPALKDIKIPKATINKSVEEEITNLLPSLKKTDLKPLPADTAAIKGYAVDIYYTGRAKDPNKTLSDETLRNMSNAKNAYGYNLILGSGSFIPGFEDQLIGAKAGDQVAVNVTFPENYGNTELNGLEVIFDVTVNAVKRAVVSEVNTVAIYVTYALNGAEANGDIATFLAKHAVTINMADTSENFDEYFDAKTIADAIKGKALYEEFTLPMTLSAEQAKEFGYETELSLTATMMIADIVYYPTELCDEDIWLYTGGTYPTAEAFRQYLFDYYKVLVTYDTLVETIVFAEIPKDVYEALYQGYYDSSIKDQIGDTSDMTEEELAAALTDAVKEKADKFGKENATAEWNDRMMMAYLKKVTGFVLSDEVYKKELKELYDYYVNYEPMMVYYYGITSPEVLESLFGKDSLVFKFTNDQVLELVANTVTYVD